MVKRILHTLVALAMLAAVSVGVGVVTAAPAAALCAPSQLDGTWYNINANTRAITKTKVETCQPVTVCNGSICTTRYDAGTFISVYGKCHPTDCAWGRKQTQDMGDGWIRAIYSFGFKTSYVWAKNYTYYGQTYLRVYVFNDFTPADGRADYVTDEWFLK